MNKHSWINECAAAITVCDAAGIIIEMNDAAIITFEKDGGEKLIGKNVLDCHPEPSRTQLKELLETQKPNVYTIEKNSAKKLIYQMPWYNGGKYGGIVELSLVIPDVMPHFVRS